MALQRIIHSSAPTLGTVNGHSVLMVDGMPFILLGGEVHNSSSSSLKYMEQVWEKAESLGMNCLLLSVAWELVEPEEGCFDFSLVQGLIEQARAHGMKIAFLWFGAWKNAQCYYAPAWVKTDPRRFRRAEIEKGKGFICMKPLAGGAIENAPLAMRFIASNKDITVNIPGMASEDELKQNVAAACDPAPLSEEELREVQNIRDTLGNQFCRRCNYCQPCTMGINISFCFTINGYLTRYGLKDWAIGRYKGMAVEPNACIECGMCESRCPYHLPIIEMLKDVYSNVQKEMK